MADTPPWATQPLAASQTAIPIAMLANASVNEEDEPFEVEEGYGVCHF